MHSALFATTAHRSRRVYGMLLGSLLFHAALIGIAALWPDHPAAGKPPIIVDIGEGPEPPFGPQITDLPLSTPAVPGPETPTLPDPPVETPPEDPTPPPFDPEMVELSTPPPPVIHRHQPALATAVHGSTATQPVGHTTGSTGGSGAGLTATSGHPGTGGTVAGASWKTSKPPYPYAMQAARKQGSGSVRVTTNASGGVVSATVVESTGSALLDENTCRYARGFWSGPPNATTVVPITYRLP